MASSTLGIASYFDETVQFYRVFWHGNTGALHFGMGCRAAGTHQQRLLNTNRVLADAIDVLPGERLTALKDRFPHPHNASQSSLPFAEWELPNFPEPGRSVLAAKVRESFGNGVRHARRLISEKIPSDSPEGWSRVADALGERMQPLRPPPPRRRLRCPGRTPLDQRQILTGIQCVLKTGIAWDDLPAELGCGGGKTCHPYRCPWHQAGVWQRWHAWRLG